MMLSNTSQQRRNLAAQSCLLLMVCWVVISLIGMPCVLRADSCGLDVVQVGKLLVFESGAVKLQMGDVVLDVAAGTPCQFRQDMASINAREGHFVFLGDVAQRVVCSPNVEQLIRSASFCIGNGFVCNHAHFVLQSSWSASIVCCDFTTTHKVPYLSGW